jgi:hypothetical protein
VIILLFYTLLNTYLAADDAITIILFISFNGSFKNIRIYLNIFTLVCVTKINAMCYFLKMSKDFVLDRNNIISSNIRRSIYCEHIIYTFIME